MFTTTSIAWDIEGEEDIEEIQAVLPQVMTISEERFEEELGSKYTTQDEKLDIVADILSDGYGWCVLSFEGYFS